MMNIINRLSKIKNMSLYDCLTIIIPSLFLTSIVVIWLLGALSLKDFINNVAIFAGWIVALSIVFMQLRKTREDNQKLKREEIKKELEINAFQEINKAVTNFSDTLGKIGSKYLALKGKLDLHINYPSWIYFPKHEIELEIQQEIIQLYYAVGDFTTSIEANEIAVITFDHLRKFIQFRVYDGIDVLREFKKYLRNTDILELRTNQTQQFNKWCNDIFETLTGAVAYLFDYRIEIMNYFMGDIFATKVPRRKPGDPKVKTLIEIAIKKEVEREEKKYAYRRRSSRATKAVLSK